LVRGSCLVEQSLDVVAGNELLQGWQSMEVATC
jgi:hypothetical protein